MNSLAYIISFLVVLVVIYVFTDSQTTVITGVALAGAVAIQQTIKYFTQNEVSNPPENANNTFCLLIIFILKKSFVCKKIVNDPTELY